MARSRAAATAALGDTACLGGCFRRARWASSTARPGSAPAPGGCTSACTDYGGLPAWLAALSVGLLSAALSLYLAIAMAAFARLRRGSVLRDALLFGALWLLAELARGVIFTGFPWIATGYAQVDSPLAGSRPGRRVRHRRHHGRARCVARPCALAGARSAVATLVATAAVLGAGALAGRIDFRPNGRRRHAAAGQRRAGRGSLPASTCRTRCAWTREQLLGARGDLVVAPETVIPLLPDSSTACGGRSSSTFSRAARPPS